MSDTLWFYRYPESGLLAINGRDWIAFLQRQTTNDIRLAAPGKKVVSILTSPEGRILDVFQVLSNGEHGMLVTLPDRVRNTFSYLKSRIFFMDQVSVENLNAQLAMVEFDEHSIRELQQLLRFQNLPESEQVSRFSWNEHTIEILWNKHPLGLGYLLIASSQAVNQLTVLLQESGYQSLNTHRREAMRIEAGIPGMNGELVDRFTPLELGLDSFVSLDKGCYTGQEVLARQVHYEKVTQKLIGLRFEKDISPGARVWENGRPVGQVTSSIQSSRYGDIGLAVIRSSSAVTGAFLQTGMELKNTLQAIVCSLPFHDFR
jgi:folate-binding protein YgfZ